MNDSLLTKIFSSAIKKFKNNSSDVLSHVLISLGSKLEVNGRGESHFLIQLIKIKKKKKCDSATQQQQPTNKQATLK